jgi:hypothetical protein
MAGKYIRSRQFSFGRGTVIDTIFFLYLSIFICSDFVFRRILGNPAAQLIENREEHPHDLFED